MRLAVLLCLALVLTTARPALSAEAGRCDSTGTAVPLIMHGRAAIVPIFIHSRRIELVLDTGANVTVLTPAAAALVGASEPDASSSGMLAVGGAKGSLGARIVGVEIGGLPVPAMDVAIDADTPSDGVLGLDVLSHFDVDIDYGHARMTLHPPGACAGQTPPMDGPVQEIRATRQIASGAAANAALAPYLMVPLTLDGATTLAMLDTGAMAGSLISDAFAAAAGVSAERLARDPVLDVQGFGTVTRLRRHVFSQMQIARERIDRPALLVGGGPAQVFPAVLGWDFFNTHRVWFDFTGNRVFIAPINR